MFDATGMMRMATKSTLNNDVSALLWTIYWPLNAGTLGDFNVKCKSIVKHGLTQGNVVLVFDRYFTNNTKSYMRLFRQEKNGGGRIHILIAEIPCHLKPQSSASLKIRCSLIKGLLVPHCC